MKRQTITVVAPCYNEGETLALFIEAMDCIRKELLPVALELLLVNDGSQDNTLLLMREYAATYEWIDYLSFSRNFGKEAGILAGMQHAQGEWVVLMDADLQDPPQLLPEMLRLVREEGYDVVGTRRTTRQGEPPIRSFLSHLYYKVNNRMTKVHLEPGVRDYRLMTRQVVEAFNALPEHNRFSKGIFSWVGFKVHYLPYENIERTAGKTSWSLKQLFSYAIEGIMSFSDFPLTLAIWVGMFSTAIAFIYGLIIIGQTLILGGKTPGWPSLAVLVVGMGGLQLLSLGILGKYIAKIFIESKHRPHYIIQESSLKKEK